MSPKRKPLTEGAIQDDFDPQAVEQLRQSINIPVVSRQVEPNSEEPPQIATKRLNVAIPEDLHRWLKSYSGREGKSITDVVMDLLNNLRATNE
jgi:predicted HicB family RNase H-like nuclease